jgi:hypothetical protein
MRWSLQSRGKTHRIDGINRPREPAEAILYDWAFHRNTLTDPGGLEYLISRNRIVGIWRNGNGAIPADGFVYSVGPQVTTESADLKVNASVKITYQLSAEGDTPQLKGTDWQAMDYIVGGMLVLFRNRRPAFESNGEHMRPGFVEERHPRIAVGLCSDGTWVFVVIDGRQPDLSVGMSLSELADTLLSLNCVDALNLDGGGSSTLYYEGKVVNSPSEGGKERPVSDAILIMKK